MGAIDDAKVLLDKYQVEVQKAVDYARLEGFGMGMGYTDKIPSAAKFKKDHATPVNYGDDFATVVYASDKIKAAKLLETVEEFVEKIGVGWEPYYVDGGIQVGYYIGDVTSEWYAWGLYL